MIRDIMDGICQALSNEFGSRYEIYTESLPQGMKEPCFFVLCISQGHEAQIKNRYWKKYQFGIHYFPASAGEPYAECQAVSERLCLCLELIDAGNKKILGKEMNGRVEDSVLIFTIEYDPFICRPLELTAMEKVMTDAKAKE